MLTDRLARHAATYRSQVRFLDTVTSDARDQQSGALERESVQGEGGALGFSKACA